MTLGENIGQVLHSIAWDHLLEFEPDKAVDVWIGGFQGMSQTYAKQAVIGNFICTLDPNDNGGVLMKNKEEFTFEELDGYPTFDRMDIWRKIVRTVNVSPDADKDRDRVRYNFDEARYQVMCWIDFNKTIRLEKELYGVFGTTYSYESFPLRKLLKYWFENDRLPDSFDIDDCDERSESIVKWTLRFIDFCDTIVLEFPKIKKTVDFVIDAYKLEDNEKFEWRHLLNGIELIVEDAHDWLQYVQELCINSPEGWQDNKKDEINTYLENEKEIEKLLEAFGPVNPEERWDAGFIAPDGQFFGFNGDIASLLHIRLADAIVEYYGWEKDAEESEFGKDWFLLGKKGFIKLTGENVYYEGYDEILGKKPIAINNTQMETLKKYGKNFGKMWFGPKAIPFEVNEFVELDEYHQAQLLRNDL